MNDSVPVAPPPSADGPRLSESQYQVFWGWVVSNLEVARQRARRIVGRQDADDVVHTAAIIFVESLARSASLPENEAGFRNQFVVIVRHHAFDCVRCVRAPRNWVPPIHGSWSAEPEVMPNGRKVPDRPLHADIARSDRQVRHVPTITGRVAPAATEQLREILRPKIVSLPRIQFRILHQSFYRQLKRSTIASRLGITKDVYDYQRKLAFETLRQLLITEAEQYPGLTHQYWYDHIARLQQCRATSRRRRHSSTEGKGPSP